MQSRQDSVPSGDPDVPDDGAVCRCGGAEVPGDGVAPAADDTWPVDAWARGGAAADGVTQVRLLRR